jgi:alginate O-acetyltransferase complex protein AlgJ
MQFIQRHLRYVLPVAFFSYTAVVNLGFAEFPGRADLTLDRTALTGALTAKLDSVYRHSMPHRDPAIGAIGALRYLALGEGRKGVVTGADGWLFTDEELRPMDQPMAAPLARIADVRDALGAVGATLVVVPVPGKLDVQRDQTSPDAAAGIAALYDEFRAGLAGQGIAALDTRAALRADAATGLAFFRTDTHWTPQGAAAAAKALAASGLIAPGDAAFTVEAAAEATFTGDLVAYVTSDTLAPILGFAPEAAVPYTAIPAASDASADIFAGAQSGGTILIGTSYSANPNWSFAEALKLSLGQDVLNLAVQGQGPARPMLDYLASPAFAEAPPKLVIWEFPVRYLSDPTIWDPASKAVKSGA